LSWWARFVSANIPFFKRSAFFTKIFFWNMKSDELYIVSTPQVRYLLYIYISVDLCKHENGILLLFYIFLSHGNEEKKMKKGGRV
jgi:hypothetical protein